MKYEAEVASKVGDKWGVVYFGKLLSETNEEKQSTRGADSYKSGSHLGRNLTTSVLKLCLTSQFPVLKTKSVFQAAVDIKHFSSEQCHC